VVLIFFRFVMLATVVVIPSYLGSIKGYLPLQTGPVLLWVALPQCIFGLLAMYLLKYIDARLILTAGFTLVAIACLMNAQLSSAWSGANFWLSQAVMAVGLALAFNSMVGAIVLEVINTGALTRPIDVLTFAGYFQTVRLFGGQAGVAFMQHFLAVREQFHSNILGLGVQLGEPATEPALARAEARPWRPIIARTRYSLGTSRRDSRACRCASKPSLWLSPTSFTLVAWSVVCCLIVVACMARVPTQYQQVVEPPRRRPPEAAAMTRNLRHAVGTRQSTPVVPRSSSS
jgi:DHA2 family multidrug resistance protein